ncbi:MAG TPA: hypothetical protein DEO84_12260 [candidate division Zixibacteria bacterium]|jgi:hypothetical protein|nr:hypothetical protein [candidate division Zixibacteria bacterium]HBZ02082.1 hypothetical protein [candidate division Zixibacteria bacterium]
MPKWFLILGSFGLVLTTLSSSTKARDDNFSRGSLKGLDSIFVQIDPLPSYIDGYETYTNQIRTDTELKLRLAGINVVTSAGDIPPGGLALNRDGATLYLSFTFLGNKSSDVLTYSMELQIWHWVSLMRNIDIGSPAITWSCGGIGTQSIPEDLRRQAKDMVEIFINAYLSVNPKIENTKISNESKETRK